MSKWPDWHHQQPGFNSSLEVVSWADPRALGCCAAGMAFRMTMAMGQNRVPLNMGHNRVPLNPSVNHPVHYSMAILYREEPRFQRVPVFFSWVALARTCSPKSNSGQPSSHFPMQPPWPSIVPARGTRCMAPSCLAALLVGVPAWVAEVGIFEGSSRQKTPMKLLMLGWWWHRLRIFNSFLRTRIGGVEHQGKWGVNIRETVWTCGWGWNHHVAMGNLRWHKAKRSMTSMLCSDLQPRFSISTAEKSMILTATHAGKATFPPCLVVPMAILGHKTNRNSLPEGLPLRDRCEGFESTQHLKSFEHATDESLFIR